MISDTFKRIQVRAQAALQNTSTSTSNANDLLPKVKDWCRTRYNRIMRSFPWAEIIRSYNLSVTASTRDYALRQDLDSIIKIWDTTHGSEITAVDIRDHIRFTAPQTEVAGNVLIGDPENYIEIGTKGCSALMSIADKVQVLSTSASDVSPVVIRIQGEVSGILVGESLTLTGVTAVDSTNTYDASSELIISSGTSSGTLQDLAGVVTVREKTTSTNILAKFAPGDRVSSYKWIRITPMPSSSATFQVWYKKSWLPLNNDNDVPLIPCADEIIAGVIADALWEDGQANEATAQESKFNTSVNELWISTRQRNLISQIVPEVEPGYYDGHYFVGHTYT